VLFKELMENIGQTFMANNPGTKLNFRAPENGDEEIMQRNLRDAVTNSLPDVAFHGLNRQRTL
jgi:multiple sugar transport system substrate-binding protein